MPRHFSVFLCLEVVCVIVTYHHPENNSLSEGIVFRADDVHNVPQCGHSGCLTGEVRGCGRRVRGVRSHLVVSVYARGGVHFVGGVRV
jgi:hypothetical protein